MKNLLIIASLLTTSSLFAAPNADNAQALLKKNECIKCHAIDKTKSGPSYKTIAKKYSGKADAEAGLIKMLTSHPEHKHLEASPDEIKNAVQWILSSK